MRLRLLKNVMHAILCKHYEIVESIVGDYREVEDLSLEFRPGQLVLVIPCIIKNDGLALCNEDVIDNIDVIYPRLTCKNDESR